jgi:hypothetical protein
MKRLYATSAIVMMLVLGCVASAWAVTCHGNACQVVTIKPHNPTGFDVNNSSNRKVHIFVKWLPMCVHQDIHLGPHGHMGIGNGGICGDWTANYE